MSNLKKLIDQKKEIEKEILDYEKKLLNNFNSEKYEQITLDDVFNLSIPNFCQFCDSLFKQKINLSIYKDLIVFPCDKDTLFDKNTLLSLSNHFGRIYHGKELYFNKKSILLEFIFSKLNSPSFSMTEKNFQSLHELYSLTNHSRHQLTLKIIQSWFQSSHESIPLLKNFMIKHKLFDESFFSTSSPNCYTKEDFSHFLPYFNDLHPEKRSDLFILLIRNGHPFASEIIQKKIFLPTSNVFLSKLYSDKTLGLKIEFLQAIGSVSIYQGIMKTLCHIMEKFPRDERIDNLFIIGKHIVDTSSFEDKKTIWSTIEKRADSILKNYLKINLEQDIIISEMNIDESQKAKKMKI